MRPARELLLAGSSALALAGCAATAARQSMASSCPPAYLAAGQAEASRPDETRPSLQAAQQSGQGNVSGQIDAGGWKGIEYASAVPVGQVILMGLMLWLSHRREMARIGQNGGRERKER